MIFSRLRNFFSPEVALRLPEGTYWYSHTVEFENDVRCFEGELQLPISSTEHQLGLLFADIQASAEKEGVSRAHEMRRITTHLIASFCNETTFNNEMLSHASRDTPQAEGFVQDAGEWSHRTTGYCESWLILLSGSPHAEE